MVPRPNRDTFLVQYGAQIVRVNPVEGETDNADRICGPEQGHIVALAQFVAQLGG